MKFVKPKVNKLYKNMITIEHKTIRIITDKELEAQRKFLPANERPKFKDIPEHQKAMIKAVQVKFYEYPLIHALALDGMAYSFRKSVGAMVFFSDKDQKDFIEHRKRYDTPAQFPEPLIIHTYKGSDHYIELNHEKLLDASVSDMEKLAYLADEAGAWQSFMLFGENAKQFNMEPSELHLDSKMESLQDVVKYVRLKFGE